MGPETCWAPASNGGPESKYWCLYIIPWFLRPVFQEQKYRFSTPPMAFVPFRLNAIVQVISTLEEAGRWRYCFPAEVARDMYKIQSSGSGRSSACWQLGALLVLLAGLVYGPFAPSAYGSELEELIERYDHLTVISMKRKNLAPSIETAEEIVRIGRETGDASTELRGCIRRAFAEIYFGRWDPQWEEWRSKSVSILSSREVSALARAEYFMLNGFLEAMYLGNLDRGIRQINEAIVVFRSCESDYHLAHAFMYLGLILPFDGQPILAQQCINRSIIFGRRAGLDALEYRTLVIAIHVEDGYRQISEEKLARSKELADKLDGEVSYSHELDLSVERLKEIVEQSVYSLELPANKSADEQNKCLVAAGKLIPRLVSAKKWDEAEHYLAIAERASELLQNKSGRLSNNRYRAILYAKDGDIERAREVIKPYVDYLIEFDSHKQLAVLYDGLGNWFHECGFPEDAVEMLAEASKYRKSDRTMKQAAVAAERYVKNELKLRELTAEIRATEAEAMAASRFRYILASIGILLGGACVGLVYRVRSHHRAQLRLQQLVSKQTESLRLAKEQAERANRAKTDYLARVNHELRNPLTALINSCEHLDQLEDKKAQGRFTETIRACTTSLLDVVDEVLDFTQIESGHLTLRETSFAPSELLDGVCSIIRPKLKPGVKLSCTLRPEVPSEIWGDESKLRQILLNLGFNSARHTDSGNISLECKVENTAGKADLVFTVRDTGFGISQEWQGHLFRQYESFSDRPSIGLGLYISEAFAELMGGTIDYVAPENEGAIFTVRVPMQIPPCQSQKLASSQLRPVYNKRILAIDDDEVNLNSLGALLKAIQMSCSLARNWDEAEHVLHEGVDVVLLDLRMPGVNGFEIAERIRLMPNPPAILAVTGDVTEQTRKEVELAGFSGFIPKPFTLSVLTEAIASTTQLPSSSNVGEMIQR